MKRLTKEEFINAAIKIHENKYSYELVNYLGNRIKVKIICPIHGTFTQLPKNHIHLKQGCPSCYGNKKLTTLEFIKKSNNVHLNKYDYSKSNYLGNKSKVIIICKKHGEFLQTATRHLSGDGCPKCSESKGERIIREFLTKNSINFKTQVRFSDCKNINELPFDFYIPDKKILIEYDGQQHFNKSKGFKFDYSTIKRNDEIKNNFAKKNGYDLLRIPYTKLKKINEILNNII